MKTTHKTNAAPVDWDAELHLTSDTYARLLKIVEEKLLAAIYAASPDRDELYALFVECVQ